MALTGLRPRAAMKMLAITAVSSWARRFGAAAELPLGAERYGQRRGDLVAGARTNFASSARSDFRDHAQIVQLGKRSLPVAARQDFPSGEPHFYIARRTSVVTSLVVTAIDEPLLRSQIQPVNGAVFEHHVPFIAAPDRIRPPVARSSPGAGALHHSARQRGRKRRA